MPVPFGFSIGDFISGVELLIDAVKSLRDTNGAQDDYRELGRELKHLRNGLECIEALSLDPTQPVQFSAAKAAVHDCLLCLDDFIQRNAKFSSLGSTPPSHWTVVGLKNRWRMVQWALWKKADVSKFKSEVQQHAEAIQMLLATIHINQLSAQGKLHATSAQQSANHKQLTEGIGKNVFDQGVEQQRFKRTLDDQHKLVNTIRNDVHTVIGRQTYLAQSMTADYRKTRDNISLQGRDQETSARDSKQNIAQLQADVKHAVTQVEVLLSLERSMAGGKTQYQRDLLQAIISNQDTVKQNQQTILAKLHDIDSMSKINQAIPAQVLLSTPVVLLDARGRCAPFHLEFIDPFEAFKAVLKIRFKDIGLRKIESGQFALEDTRRKESLRLSDAWSTIVRPGQHISMSMIFRLQGSPTASCPSCGHENEGSNGTEIECANITCRLAYRRIVDISSSENDQSEEDREASSLSSSSLNIASSASKGKRADSQEKSVDDDIKQYTRVQIFTQEMFEEEEGDLPLQYRRLTVQLQTGSDDLKRRLPAYPANHVTQNCAFYQTIMKSHADLAVPSSSSPRMSSYGSGPDQEYFNNISTSSNRTDEMMNHKMITHFYVEPDLKGTLARIQRMFNTNAYQQNGMATVNQQNS